MRSGSGRSASPRAAASTLRSSRSPAAWPASSMRSCGAGRQGGAGEGQGQRRGAGLRDRGGGRWGRARRLGRARAGPVGENGLHREGILHGGDDAEAGVDAVEVGHAVRARPCRSQPAHALRPVAAMAGAATRRGRPRRRPADPGDRASKRSAVMHPAAAPGGTRLQAATSAPRTRRRRSGRTRRPVPPPSDRRCGKARRRAWRRPGWRGGPGSRRSPGRGGRARRRTGPRS